MTSGRYVYKRILSFFADSQYVDGVIGLLIIMNLKLYGNKGIVQR